MSAWLALALALGVAVVGGRARADALVVHQASVDADAMMPHVQVLVDEGTKLTERDVLSRSLPWRPLDRAQWNVGYSTAAYWLRFSVRASEQGSLWYLGLNRGVDDARLYRRNASGELAEERLGRRVDFARRPIAAAGIFFPLRLDRTTCEVLVRVQSTDTLQLQLTLDTPSDLARRLGDERWLQGLYFGALCALIVYNFVLYLLLRERVYLWYVLFEASILAVQAALDQVLFDYLWPSSPGWNAQSEVVFFGMAMGFAFAFSRDFLETSGIPRLDRALRLLQYIGFGISACFWLADEIAFTRATMLYLLVACCTLLAAGAVRRRQGNSNARVYLLGWGALLLGAAVTGLAALGVFPAGGFSQHVMRVCSVTEALLFALGLAARIESLRAENEQARLAILSQRAAHAEHLEGQVMARTQELRQALAALQSSQASMMQQARLAALGHLIDGVVHEVANPLNFLRGGADALPEIIEEAKHALARAPAGPSQAALANTLGKAQTAASLVASGSERIRLVLDNLRAYASSRVRPATTVDVAEAVRATVALMAQHLDAHAVAVELSLDVTARVRAQPGEIGQVMTNLFLNAVQAMPEGGRLRVRASEDARWVRLQIEDTGHGIPFEIRCAIFDPFFTTRGPSEGTGLGLSIAREIAVRHGGGLCLLDREQGCAFELTLPIEEGGGRAEQTTPRLTLIRTERPALE